MSDFLPLFDYDDEEDADGDDAETAAKEDSAESDLGEDDYLTRGGAADNVADDQGQEANFAPPAQRKSIFDTVME